MNFSDNAVKTPIPKAQKRLYNLSEAAVYLGRSLWSIRRLIWNGALPVVKQGRRVQIDIEDMEEFISRNKLREFSQE